MHADTKEKPKLLFSSYFLRNCNLPHQICVLNQFKVSLLWLNLVPLISQINMQSIYYVVVCFILNTQSSDILEIYFNKRFI